MRKSKKTIEELITSLYDFTKSGFEEMRIEMREGFTTMNQRFEKVETRLERLEDKVDDTQKSVNGHENRISRLEDSNRIIKTKLGFS